MRILVAGDSLGLPRPNRINNYSPDETELAVAYENTYSSIVNKNLLEHFKMDPFIEMINRSRRFQTMKNVYEEFTDHLFFYEPDVIIIQVGIVDCWFRESLNGKQMVDKVSFEKYLSNILMLLNMRPLCKLIIIGISPTSKKMEKKFVGINSEIRLYNEILKAHVDNKNVFYVDMEKHVDSEQTQRYLLPDDHHLNRDGNKLVAEQLICILKGFIFTNLGIQKHNKGKSREALNYFTKSFKEYPMNTDNICNLLIIYYEIKDKVEMNLLIDYVKDNNIKDKEISGIISVFEMENNNSF
ncbi:SGNH/GDSL hydrolase family protein [Psychrobacillus sp. FSL H8-0483]|uniref:SGNH/GDSL hydrolase family protein n=1 Tax=Psychrobacillus sp. FSL H8-0483 TaxID=2921389 RepID=UPI003159C158